MAIIPYYATDDNGNIHSPIGLPLPNEVRNRWCYGLSLADAQGQPMSDQDLLRFLIEAVKETERRLGILLKPTLIRCNAEERRLKKGIDYEREEPPYDYDAQKWRNFGFLQLRQRYISELARFTLMTYNGQVTIDFMEHRDWVKIYKKSAQVHVMTKGLNMPMGTSYSANPTAIPFTIGLLSYTPQVFHVDYTAGMEEITEDIRAVIGKQATVSILGVAGDACTAGMAGYSLTIDGASESYQSTASAMYGTYSAHIMQLRKEIEDFFNPAIGGARSKYRGITLGGI